MASIRAVTAGLGGTLRVAAAAALGLGLAHCSTDLSDLAKGSGSESNNPLGQTPGWSRPYPIEGPANPGEGTTGSPSGEGTGTGTGPTPEELVGSERWCSARRATFCADFDEPMPLERFSAGVEGQTFPAVDAGFDVSAPFALLVDVPETLNREDTFASRITQHFSQRVNGFLLDFQLSPELVSRSVAIVAAVDFLGNGAATYSLHFVYEGGALHLDELVQGASKRLVSTTLPSGPQRWSHINLDVDFGGLPRAAFKLVEDQSKVERLVGSAALSPTAGMSNVPSLVMGIAEGQRPHNGWKLRYDNVAFELR